MQAKVEEMNFAKVEEVNSVQKRLTITVPSNEVDHSFQLAWQRIQRKANIRGFRPGKAPLSVIKRLYNEQGVQDVRESLINKYLVQSLEANALNPISNPILNAETSPVIGENYVFSAVIDLWPEVKLEEAYKDLPITSKTYTYDETDTERELRTTALRHAKIEGAAAPETKAAEGYEAVISTIAKNKDEVVAELTKDKVPVVLGYHQVKAEIEKAVVGLKVGEKATVQWDDKTNPTDFFEVTLHELKKLDIPELTDEFAKDLGMNTLDELKQKINDHLQASCDDREKRELESLILDELCKKIEFQVPPSIVENVIDNMILESGVIADKAHRDKALGDAKLRKYLETEAETKARKNILLRKFIEDEAIEVTEAEVKAASEEIYKSESSRTSAEKAKAAVKEYQPRIRENILYDKALKKLISYVKVTKVPTKLWTPQQT